MDFFRESVSFMRSLFTALIVLMFPLTMRLQAQQWIVKHADTVITDTFIKARIDHLASNQMMGRSIKGGYVDSAAFYIADEFRRYGLKALNGSYYQDIDYCYTGLGKNNFLAMITGLATVDFILEEDFIPLEITGAGPAEADVVFAGYGITAPEYGYDDYANIHAEGKIVLVLRQEPGQTDTLQVAFGGHKVLTRHSALELKRRNARDHGAIGLLVVNGPLNYQIITPEVSHWKSSGSPTREFLLPVKPCSDSDDAIPVMHVGEKVVNALLGSVDSLERLQRQIERTLSPVSFRITGRSVAMNVSLDREPLPARNVIGYLEGSDPRLKDEVVIVGAHYDHVGYRTSGAATGADTIFNGADDNASGTAGIMAIAKAFTTLARPPERSVLFIAFACEEMGLLGSRTYVKHPLVPLTSTRAMLNLDMIGRNHRDTLMIIGALQNPDLVKIIRKENRKTGLKLRESKRKRISAGSDHYPFFINHVSAVFFFTGLHEDYHQVSDHADLIDSGKAANVSKLAFYTAWKVADSKKILKIRDPEEEDEN